MRQHFLRTSTFYKLSYEINVSRSNLTIKRNKMIHEVCVKFKIPTKQRFQRLVCNEETEEPIFNKKKRVTKNKEIQQIQSDGNSRSMLWFIILFEMLSK